MQADLYNSHGELATAVQLPGPGDRVRVSGLSRVLTVTAVEIHAGMAWISGTYPRSAGKGPDRLELNEPYTACVGAGEFRILTPTGGR